MGARHELEHGRNWLATQFTGVGVEVGTEQGVFAKEIAKYAETLYCVDPWKAYKGYRDHVSQRKLDGFHEKVCNELPPHVIIVRKFSIDAVKEFDDNSLDFVYIDANHDFQNVTNDICEWGKKVKVGGIVSGHDYRRTKGGAVNDTVDVVNAYTYAKGIDPWYVLRGDRASSWMWRKT